MQRKMRKMEDTVRRWNIHLTGILRGEMRGQNAEEAVFKGVMTEAILKPMKRY